MTTLLPPTGPALPVVAGPPDRRRGHGAPVIGPGWWSAVLGTAAPVLTTHALAGVTGLPAPLRRVLTQASEAALVPLIAVALVVVLLSARSWCRDPRATRAAWADVQQAQTSGALPMALLALATAVLVAAPPEVLRLPGPVAVAVGCWLLGAVLSVVTAVVVPRRTWAGAEATVTGAWLMPVVAPLVTAATAPSVLPVLPVLPGLPGGIATDVAAPLLLLALGCVVLAGVLALRIAARVWLRLRWRTFPAAAVPTLWVALGPCGQAATAAHTLSALAADTWPRLGTPLTVLGVLLALPPLGLGLAWLAVLLRLTPALRGAVPGAAGLSWWALTFPVGTLVTGLAGLAGSTGVLAPAVLGLGLLGLLAGGWLVAARASLVLLAR